MLSGPRIAGLTKERSVLLFGILLGAGVGVLSVGELATGPELDFHAYYFAAEAAIEGRPFVGWTVMEGTFLTDKAYVYTPITVFVFFPYGLLPTWQVAYVLNTMLLVGIFYKLGQLTITYVERQGGALEPTDRYLILGFCILSVPSIVGLYRGNVDPVVLLSVVVGFLALERGSERLAGAAWAVAALFKLFPALLGVWFLYRRAYRAVATALAVGLGAIAISIGVFGVETHLEFVEFILTERSREGAFVGGVDPNREWITLRRPLSQFLSLSGHQLTLLSFGILAVPLAWLYWRANSELARLATFFATFLALLITIIPSTAGYVVYLLFPLVALLYLVDDARAKGCFLTAAVLINLPVYPHHIDRGLEAAAPSAVAESVLAITYGVLRFGSVGLWAFSFAFAGCLFVVLSEVADDE